MIFLNARHLYITTRFCVIALFFIIISAALNRSYAQAPAISYATPQSFNVNQLIAPLSPGNTGGAVPATIYGQVTTYTSGLNTTTGVGINAAGDLFVESFGNNQIDMVSASTHLTSVFAGSGASGSAGGQGKAATFYEPDGMVLDNAGNIYVSEIGNSLIRKITAGGLVSTFAGTGTLGAANGPGATASFNSPRGMAIDAAGNLYVADQGNNMVRKITPAGVVSTVAGSSASGFLNGTAISALFNTPTGVGIDQQGNLYITDAGNNAVRKITVAGVVSTFATGLNFPREVRADNTGNLYVSNQSGNNIVRISPAGVVSLVAGTGLPGSTDGNGNVATFNGPLGVVLDGTGNMFIGDDANSSVRKVVVSGYTIDKALPAGLVFDQKTGIISGTPTVLSAAANYTVTAYNGSGSNSTIVNIEVITPPLPKQSIISFLGPVNINIGANNILYPGATTNNNETPVTYTSSNPAVAYLGADGQLHVIAPGTTVITASQAGNAHFIAATPVPVTFYITQPQVIQFAAIPVKTPCNADFACGAVTSNPLLPLGYASSNSSVATISAQGVIHIAAAGTTVITVSQAGNALYTAAVPQTQTLTVKAPAPPVILIAANTATICVGNPITFNATATKAGTNPVYQWRVNGVNAGTNSSTFITTALATADVVQCTITNNDTCTVSATSNQLSGIIVAAYVTPSVTIASSASGAVCGGSAVKFTATPTNGGTNPSYQWQVNGINAGTNNTTLNSTAFANNDLVTCILTNTTSPCLAPATVTSNSVAVSLLPPANPAPSISIASSAVSVYTGTPVTFTAATSNAGPVASYQWKINGGNAGTSSTTFTSSKLRDKDSITCTAILSTGCTVSVNSAPLVITILPSPYINIPTAFTPNGDGVNDTWNISGLFYYPNCIVSIYSRYGAELYQSKGYASAWDGTTKGTPLPLGTYYYVVDLGNGNSKLSGAVTVLK